MRTVRFLMRALSLAALIAAVVAGTMDSVNSVSSSSVVMTSLGNAWLNFDPEGLTMAEISANSYVGSDTGNPRRSGVFLLDRARGRRGAPHSGG